MPQDLKVARPFAIVGSDRKMCLYGIGLYPGVDDAVATLSYVQWHLEAAVVARGEWLAQMRWTVPPVTSQIIPQFIWLRPENASMFSTTIEAGWAPAYQDSRTIQHFPRMAVPQPDALHIATDPITGTKGYRLTQRPDVFRHQPFPNLDLAGAIRVRPGDGVNPPITVRAEPPVFAEPKRLPVDNSLFPVRQPDTAFAVLQAAQAAQAAAMAAPPPSTQAPRTLAPQSAGGPATPVPKAWDQQQYYDRDPRQSPPVDSCSKHFEQQPAPDDERQDIPALYDIRNARTRLRLNRPLHVVFSAVAA